MPITKYKSEIVVAFIGALATIISAVVSLDRGKEDGLKEAKRQITLQVNVFNASSSSGIADALVRLSGDGVNESRQTDSTGRVTVELPFVVADHLARLQVEATNFQSKTEEIRLVSGYKQHDIRLSPSQPVAVLPPPPAQSTETRAQRVFSSGPRLSGSGSAFSDWHTLCSDGLPGNARIISVTFALSGDRRCGAWANCRESERTANRVCYQFQMQGHNEWPAPGQASSEGILTVEYAQSAA
jgi:hypothetical protein